MHDVLICSILAGEGEVYMLGGKHHGTLGESHKMDLIKHLSGNAFRIAVSSNLLFFLFFYLVIAFVSGN